MTAINNLQELFTILLRDVYYAEKKIVKSFPKMGKAVGKESKLAVAFSKHVKETEDQIMRLEKVFELIGEKPRTKTCEAIEGLNKEAEDVMEHAKNTAVMEAGLLASAQAIKHYEIARYGTLVAWAKVLGYHKAAELLQDILNEEKQIDELLSEMSIREINERAHNAPGKNDDDEE